MYDEVMFETAICTVAVGPPHWQYVASVVGLQSPGTKTYFVVEGKQGIDEGHNRAIELFLGMNFLWMLHVDSDMFLHPNTLLRLLSWDEPIVSALYTQRRPPYAPIVYPAWEGWESVREGPDVVNNWLELHPKVLSWDAHPVVMEPRPQGALVEVRAGGAGCLLVRRDVFEAIDPPWFERAGRFVEEGRGSDFDFYSKARTAGFKCFVDLSCVARHIVHGYPAGLEDFLAYDKKE